MDPGEKFAAALAELAVLVDRLTEDLDIQVERLGRAYKWIAFGYVLLLGAVVYLGFQERDLRAVDRASIENRAQIEAVLAQTNDDVLCPLYELFLFSYNPQSPVATADPVQYEQSFQVIEKGAKVLECKTTERHHR